MSEFPDAASPAAPFAAAPDARAARLENFKREQLIVDYLNRGVSVAEIAARVGIGEKRMRAVVKEILGPPHAGAARGVCGDPGEPSQRGAAGRL